MSQVATPPPRINSLQALASFLSQYATKQLAAGLLGALGAALIWEQYKPVLNRKRPAYSFELPIIGGNFSVLWHTYQQWARTIVNSKNHAALTYVFGANTVVVTWPVYEKYVRKADTGGQLDQGSFPSYIVDLIGKNSMLFMRAGKGQQHHHRLRNKVLASLTPKRVLGLVPLIAAIIRDELDHMAQDTQTKGFARFQDRVQNVATRVSALPITGGLCADDRLELERLFKIWGEGLIALPIDLGSLSALGRAKLARKSLVDMIRRCMQHTQGDGEIRSVVADLAKCDSESEAFSEAEVVDTIFTLLFAGQFTTTEALPPILVELSQRPEWRAKIAGEALEFDSLEVDSAALRFVRECLRFYPPEVFFFRQNKTDSIDLGDHGVVPVGCNVAVNFGEHMWQMGADFDPDRWTDPSLERERFLSFGGHSPHNCVGRGLAMLEMQIFCRIVAREYDVDVLDTTQVRNWSFGGLFLMYRDGCKVRVTKRSP